MQKRGTLCRWWLEEGGRKKHVFKTITGRSPPKIKTERKKGKKERAIFQFQARAVSSQECEAKVVPNLGFPSPAQLQGGRGCAGRRGSGIGDTSIATRLGSTSASLPGLLVVEHTQSPHSKPSPFAEPPRVHLRSGQFRNSLGGPGGARRGVFRSSKGSPSRGGGRSRGDPPLPRQPSPPPQSQQNK